MLWDAALIESTVTRQFVCSHLLPEEILRLNTALGFGDGLTDGTYWDWIEEKAKRIFLILVDLGIPDQIFGLVDDSWDDGDLPIALDQVDRLALTATRDDRFNRRFYQRQFHYLLRHLQKGDHLDYDDDEIVPIDVADKRQVSGLGQAHGADKIELASRPGEVFSRRRFPVGNGPGMLSPEEFLHEVSAARGLQNDHLVTCFASYTHQGYGYVLFTPASEFNLRAVLATNMPPTLKAMEKNDRRLLLMNWIHCMADTLCYLHNRGRSHGNIRPSTVLFSQENQVFYSNTSRLGAEALVSSSDKSAFDRESYDYAAPEQWYRPGTGANMHRKNTMPSSSASPENYTFSINRGSSDAGISAALLHNDTPHLDAQAADIFSLGCVILELLTFQMKRQTKAFATHRAAKHKTPGRGGAVLDASFHKNLGQVESWMSGLAKDAAKKDDIVFRGVAPMLQVVARMLSALPQDRPNAREVEQRMYKIVTEKCNIKEPHCVHQYAGWDFGVSNLRIGKEQEPLSISTKRTSSIYHRPLEHRRTNSSGRDRAASPTSPASPVSPLSNGFQAFQNARVNKVRQWESPAYAETSFG